jgi:hypothetical protein
MHEGMLPVPGVVRRLVPSLAVAVVVATPLLPGAASAREPAGSTVRGELVQAWAEVAHDADPERVEAAQPITWVETPGGESVRIPTEDAAGLTAGSTVEVTVGGEVGDAAPAEGLEPARELLDGEVLAVRRPVPVVTNQVTVALVAPGGVAHDAVRPQQVAAAVDGPVATFWSEQTSGAVDLDVVEAHDWVDTTIGCGDPGRLWDEAAREVGFTPGAGKHLVLYLSSAAPENCAYGLAEVGSQISSGGRVYVRDVLPSLIAHELGHNFGLGHSSALYCADGAETGGCDTAAYRDMYDVMGASWTQVGTLNAVQAATLGLVDASAQRTLRADGSSTDVALAPLAGSAGVRAVRLVGHDGRSYWLELRTPTGQDRWLGTDADRFGLQSGVLVRRVGDWPNTSLLLDATPSSGRDGDYQAAVPVGTTVRLTGGFALTVTSAGTGGATLRIASTAPSSGALPDAPADVARGGDAPEVLAGEASGTTSGAALAPATASGSGQPAEAADGPSADARPADATAAAVHESQTLAAARPGIVPASDSRHPALPAAAAAVLAAGALLVGVQLLRTRVRR